MSFSEIAPVVAFVALGLAMVSLALLLVVNTRLKRIQRAQRVVLGSRGDVDVVTHVTNLDDKVTNLRSAVEVLGLEARDHEVRIDGCLSRMGIVRFDAFHDLGGRQSTSVAFMDARENGVVVTTAVSREFSRMYVKVMRDGQSDIPLAPEEVEAVEIARASAPFTVRPRLEPSKEEQVAPDEESPPEPEAMSEAALRALERENRRRVRQGLEPLDELPPAPSTLGWPTPEPTEAEPSEAVDDADASRPAPEEETAVPVDDVFADDGWPETVEIEGGQR